LDALDAAAVRVLDKRQTDLLRRAIRFVRHKPPTEPKQHPETLAEAEGGTPASKASAKVQGGDVEVRTGGKWAYSLSYKGGNVDDARWLQFIWREIRVKHGSKMQGEGSSGTPLERRMEHSELRYWLTTDPNTPNLNTDTGTRHSAFYEEN